MQIPYFSHSLSLELRTDRLISPFWHQRRAVLLILIMLALLVIIVSTSQEADALTDHDPIHIVGDTNFTTANGVVSGSGSLGDPYIISGWNISFNNTTGLMVEQTSKYFVIENLTIMDSSTVNRYSAIKLEYVKYATIRNLSMNNSNSDSYGINVRYANNGWLNISNVTGLNYSEISTFRCKNVTLTDCYVSSYYIRDSTDAVIKNCTAFADLFDIYKSWNVTLLRCNGSNNTIGLRLYSSDSCVVESCVFTNNSDYDVGVSGWNNRLRNTTVGPRGISTSGYHDIDGTNTVNGKKIYYNKNATGLDISGDVGQVILINCSDSRIHNITLDGLYQGIYLRPSSNIRCENIKVSATRYAIYMRLGSNITLVNVTAIKLKSSHTDRSAVRIRATLNVTFQDCYVKGNNSNGIYYDYGSTNTSLKILNSTLTGGTNGLYGHMSTGTDYVIDNCTFSSSSNHGFFIYQHRSVTITNSTVYIGGKFTLGTGNATITGNTFIDCSIGLNGGYRSPFVTIDSNRFVNCSGTAILLWSTSGRVSNNTIRACSIGIAAQRDQATIENNTIDGCQIGIWTNSNNTTIRNNVITNASTTGIQISRGGYNEVSDCRISGPSTGILLSGSDNGTVGAINLDNCTIGILLEDANNNTISKCIIRDCISFGVEINGSYDNQVYHNTLNRTNFNLSSSKYNGPQAKDSAGGNQFDDGERGNLWWDYQFRYPDARVLAGGVWDTPYVLSGTGGSSDRYPIVSGVDLIPPVAVAGPDIFIDQNSTVMFNASLSRDNFGIADFEWSFSYDGEDILLTGEVTTFTFDIPGFYLVKLVVVDKFNNLANDTLNVTVRDTQPPVVLMDSNVPRDMGGWFELNGSRSWDNVGITSYLWIIDPEGSFIMKTGVVVNHTILTPGKYDVMLNVSDAAGNWAVGNLTITLLDIENPIADAGNDIEIDQGMEVTLDGTGSYDNGVIVEYHWNFDDNGEMVDLYGSHPTYRFLVPGTYTITLKVTDSADLTGFDEVVVVVLDREAPLARAGDDIEIEQGQIASFDGTDSFDNVGIVTYRWTFEHNATDVVLEGATATFTFEVPGVYTITLTVTDDNDLVDHDELTVTVHDTIAPVADAGPDIEVDMGEELTLDGRASSDNVGIVNYTWIVEAFGEEMNKTGNVTRFSISDADTYRVTLTVIDAAGNWAKDTLNIVVLDTEPPRLRAVMTERIDPGTALEMDATLSTDNVGVVGAVWIFDYDGEEVELTGMVETFTFDIQGDYTIYVRIYDAMGNEDSYYWDLEVSDIESPVAAAGEAIEPLLGTTLQLDGTRSTDNIGIVKYEWKIGIEYGSQALLGPTPTVEIDKTGLFVITLTVWDEAGNFDSDGFQVNVRPVLAPVRLGPFLDEDGKPLFDVEITMTLNGTVYTRRTNDDGNGTMDVEWYDIPGNAQVHAELDGYEPFDFEVTIDDMGIPNGEIPPMVHEEDSSETSSPHILIAIVLTSVGLVILLIVLMRRR